MKNLFVKQLKKEKELGKIKIEVSNNDFIFIFNKSLLNIIINILGGNDLFRIVRAANYSSDYFVFSKNNHVQSTAYLRYLLR